MNKPTNTRFGLLQIGQIAIPVSNLLATLPKRITETCKRWLAGVGM